jgi:hypothetical protein
MKSSFDGYSIKEAFKHQIELVNHTFFVSEAHEPILPHVLSPYLVAYRVYLQGISCAFYTYRSMTSNIGRIFPDPIEILKNQR